MEHKKKRTLKFILFTIGISFVSLGLILDILKASEHFAPIEISFSRLTLGILWIPYSFYFLLIWYWIVDSKRRWASIPNHTPLEDKFAKHRVLWPATKVLRLVKTCLQSALIIIFKIAAFFIMLVVAIEVWAILRWRF
jgi:hypothetical protein